VITITALFAALLTWMAALTAGHPVDVAPAAHVAAPASRPGGNAVEPTGDTVESGGVGGGQVEPDVAEQLPEEVIGRVVECPDGSNGVVVDVDLTVHCPA
jgi:xanthine/CO dehydrogenase XdhC/CoxF family maturation factor